MTPEKINSNDMERKEIKPQTQHPKEEYKSSTLAEQQNKITLTEQANADTELEEQLARLKGGESTADTELEEQLDGGKSAQELFNSIDNARPQGGTIFNILVHLKSGLEKATIQTSEDGKRYELHILEYPEDDDGDMVDTNITTHKDEKGEFVFNTTTTKWRQKDGINTRKAQQSETLSQSNINLIKCCIDSIKIGDFSVSTTNNKEISINESHSQDD